MFRRNRAARRFPRGKRLAAFFNPNGALAAEARQAFDEANALYDRGDYAPAAESFTQLAGLAQNFNRPRRAVQLHLRAYEAWLKAGQPAAALQSARRALSLVVAGGRAGIALRMARQIIEELRAAGFAAEAEALANDVNTRLAGQGLSLASEPAPAPAAAAPRGRLPSACPQCGGRLPRSFGEDEIECDYCGSIVRAE